jgi:hypothetical protein
MTTQQIEIRITEVEASYQRQLNLAGKPGYDHALTEILKKDLDWLREKKNNLAEKDNTK